jgi:hypothetical protein
MSRRALFVATLVLFTGCSALSPRPGSQATPTPEAPDVTVTLENEATANATYTFTYGVVPGRVDAVRETTVDGETRVVDNLTARAGANLFRPTDVVAVEPDGALDVEGEFTLQAGDRVRGTIEDPSRSATVFLVAREGDRVVAWGSADCGDDESLTSVDFSMGDRGPGLSIGCTFRGVPESTNGR